MVKPASKTNNATQARLGSLGKSGNTGKKRSASSKNIAQLISNKLKKSRGPSSDVTNLAAAGHSQQETLILLLTKMLMLSWLVFQIIPFYLCKHCKVTFLVKMMKTMMTTIILERSEMLLVMMEERTMLLWSVKLDYQLALAVQM
jgi:hypothetical protein